MTSLPRFLAISLLTLPALLCHAQPVPAEKSEVRFVQKTESKPDAETRSSGRFPTMLGKALARQMRRPVSFVTLPRKRMIAALEAGEADVLCGYTPAWISGAVDWSRAFIPLSEVLVSSGRVPAPHALAELKGKAIGTVLGFSYPEVEQVLGADFVRDDGPASDSSLRKLDAGRYDYLLTTQNMISPLIRNGTMPAGYHVLVIKETKTMCAVTRSGHVKVAELNAAIDAIEKTGELARLLQQR